MNYQVVKHKINIFFFFKENRSRNFKTFQNSIFQMLCLGQNSVICGDLALPLQSQVHSY